MPEALSVSSIFSATTRNGRPPPWQVCLADLALSNAPQVGDTLTPPLPQPCSDKAIRLGTQAPARGSVSGLLHCAPLAVPLLDAGGAGVGCVTLLCKEASRVYSRDEQALVATIGPLLSLHATRASLREQVI